MAEVVLKTIFQFKRGYSESWVKNNPILRAGEPGYELDTGKLKIGDGTTAWNDLEYFCGDFNISVDGQSIQLNDQQQLELTGFNAALTGQVPRKNEQEQIEWYTPEKANADEILSSEEFQQTMSDYQKTTDSISVSRLVNDEDMVLIFDGGNAENIV